MITALFNLFLSSPPANTQDTTDILNMVKQLKNIGSETILATTDVVILHNHGT